MKNLTPAEEVAARIVAATTDCLWSQLDPGGGRVQLPDIELHGRNQDRIGVLEVTTTVAGERAAFAAAQAKYEITDARLRLDWFLVTRTENISLRSLQATLPSLLVRAEASGYAPRPIDTLVPGFSFNDGEEPQTSLADAGIWMVSTLPVPRRDPGRVYIKPPAQGGAFGPSSVTQAIQPVLQREDNLAKLATARDTSRRELFVWLEEGSEASMALVTPRLLPQLGASYPTDGPCLPDPVTRVWAATGHADRDVLARALWMSDGGMWVVQPSPARLA